jgi:integrase
MAINLKEFKQTKYPNLYKSIQPHDKHGFKYLLWAKIEGKLHKKILGYSIKDKLTDRSANLRADKEKSNIEAGFVSTNKITLDKLFELYFETLDTSKQWTHKKKYIYGLYIKKHLGKKRIEKIREMDIQGILNKMNKEGLSPRTRKSVMEVLNPLFKFANTNKYLRDNPTIGITVKVPSQKKIVTNATELFKKVYAGINAYYHDNPYYRALFLFGFTGRRKGEILNLKWENIDFIHNYYWIEDTKTDDQQKYQLPPYLIEPLQAIKDDRKGLVFKSPITGKKIVNIDRQMRQLKKFLELETLSMHYMRNILVSALAEQGIEAITLSGILGHKDPNTINKYLSINHHKSSQIGLSKVGDILDVEVVDE